MFKMIIFVVIMLVILYVLYDYGYMGTNSKAAVVFQGSLPKKSSWKASFVKCKGKLKRVIRFDTSKKYNFKLDVELENGDVIIEIIDINKEVVLVLDKNNNSGSVDVGDNRKYYMVVRINSATGRYFVSWE